MRAARVATSLDRAALLPTLTPLSRQRETEFQRHADGTTPAAATNSLALASLASSVNALRARVIAT